MRIFPKLQAHIDAALADDTKAAEQAVEDARKSDDAAAAERARTGDTGNVL